MSTPIVVEDLDHLKALVAAGSAEFAISLAGGALLSYKTIEREGDVWSVFNWVDDSEQELSDEELWTLSNIGEALTKRALGCLDPVELKEVNQ